MEWEKIWPKQEQRGVWRGSLFQHKEVTSDGSQSLLVKVFKHTHTHMQHSHVLTPSSSNVRLLLHTPSNLAPHSILHSLPMSPSVASQQKDPRLRWPCCCLTRLGVCLGPLSQ